MTAIIFGIGAALTLDEFALWLHLDDVYWSEQGRQSIDAVIVFAIVSGSWSSASTRSRSTTTAAASRA